MIFICFDEVVEAKLLFLCEVWLPADVRLLLSNDLSRFAGDVIDDLDELSTLSVAHGRYDVASALLLHEPRGPLRLYLDEPGHDHCMPRCEELACPYGPSCGFAASAQRKSQREGLVVIKLSTK